MSSLASTSLRRLGGERPVAQVVAGVLVAASCLVAARAFASDPLVGTLAVVLVLGSLWFLLTDRTAIALGGYVLYLGILDGYFKLGTGRSDATLVRDVLLFALVAGLLVRSQVRGQRLALPPLSGWVFAFILIVLVQLANPDAGTFTHSLGGVRQHLEFVPLFFLAFLFLQSKRSLRTLLLLLLVVATANGIVGYVQYDLDATQLSSWGPGYSKLVHGSGQISARTFTGEDGKTHIRPPALGSDAGAGGLMGMVAICGGIALVTLGGARIRILAVLLSAGAVVAIATSQGRGAVVASVVSVFAYAVLSATSRERLRAIVGIAAAALACYVLASSILAGNGSESRFQGLGPTQILKTTSSARPDQLKAIQFAMENFPLGAGLGTAGPASGVAGASELTKNEAINTESNFGYLVVETGIAGSLLILLFTLRLLVLGMVRIRRDPDSEARLLVAAVVAPLAGILVSYYTGVITSSVPTAPYLWGAGGIVAFWLIVRPEQLAVARAAEPPTAAAPPRDARPVLTGTAGDR